VSFEIEFLLQSALFKKLLESVFIRASAKVLESFVDYINEDFKKSSHQKNND
jgi:ribosome-associated toxin RatA of RatAB toxin-antitoxin module